MAESSALAVDAGEDLSAADNTSVATSGRDEVWIAGSVDSGGCRLQVPAPAGAVVERDRSSDMDNSTEDDLGTMMHHTI